MLNADGSPHVSLAWVGIEEEVSVEPRSDGELRVAFGGGWMMLSKVGFDWVTCPAYPDLVTVVRRDRWRNRRLWWAEPHRRRGGCRRRFWKDSSRAASRLVIVVRFPSEEEQDRISPFTVHRHYLTNMEVMLDALYGAGEAQPQAMVAAQRTLPGFGRMQRRPLHGVAELRRLLCICWGSELQLRLGTVAGDAFLRYSNAWAPVQAYYAVYMSIHAWLVTIGMGGPIDDHTSTLRTVASHLVRRRLLPYPFLINCTGHPKLHERQVHGLPADTDPDLHIELLAAPNLADFHPRYAKMLDPTRNARLERGRREWLARNGRKRMPKAEQRAMASRLHPTSVFDYLWRLRIRSNYGDVSSFLLSGVEDRSHGRCTRDSSALRRHCASSSSRSSWPNAERRRMETQSTSSSRAAGVISATQWPSCGLVVQSWRRSSRASGLAGKRGRSRRAGAFSILRPDFAGDRPLDKSPVRFLRSHYLHVHPTKHQRRPENACQPPCQPLVKSLECAYGALSRLDKATRVSVERRRKGRAGDLPVRIAIGPR